MKCEICGKTLKKASDKVLKEHASCAEEGLMDEIVDHDELNDIPKDLLDIFNEKRLNDSGYDYSS